jgi:prevent-host-death family protein
MVREGAPSTLAVLATRRVLAPSLQISEVVKITTIGDPMAQSVSAAEANRNFSHILREVRGGASYVVTAHGKPVARIVPFDQDDAARASARCCNDYETSP